MSKNSEKRQNMQKELKNRIKAVNQRLVELEKRYDANTWASRNLKARLSKPKINAITKKGRITLSKNLSMQQLRAIEKATNQFLASKTSSLKGMKQIKSSVVNSLQRTLSIDESDISYEDAELLYSLLENKRTRGIVEKIGASKVFNLSITAKEEGWTQKKLIDMINNYSLELNDRGDKSRLREIARKILK